MTNDLTEQGLTAARVGESKEAHRLLSRAVEQNPNDIQAWLGLAGVVETLEEKEHCFNQVLTIDANNSEAKAGLTLVEKKLAPLRLSDIGILYCYRHPATETGLRCNRCNKPICAKCAKRTPVGFRCPDCIREQEDKYYTGENSDYIVAAVVAFPLSFFLAMLFTLILGSFNFFLLLNIFLAIISAPVITGFIAEVVRWAVSKRRSRYLGHVVAGCIVASATPFLLIALLTLDIYGLIIPAVFMFVGSTTVMARLR
jgi:hypothetical protein